MDVTIFTTLISDIGFPIACVIAMGYFVWTFFNKIVTQNEKNMEAVQSRCKEREEKLYEMLTESRVVNERALETIAHYAEKLDTIQSDVSKIKTDVVTIMAKQK